MGVTVMKSLLTVLLLSVISLTIAKPNEYYGESGGVGGAAGGGGGYAQESKSSSDSQKLEESDGTVAFNQLVAAVNSADGRVKGFEGELTQVLKKAENSPMHRNYRK